MATEIASASDDAFTVVTSDVGIKGSPGENGIDGVGFNLVRGGLLDNPLVEVLQKNALASSGSQFLRWERDTTANGFNRYGEFATADAGVPRAEYEGWLVERESTNILLNSETLSTQNVTVTANEYTLSFYGTGSITLSGVEVDTLNGTGADERVSLTFTPSAGTLTLTVTGTVEKANLELGGLATSYITTEGSEETRSADIITMPAGGNIPSFALPFSLFIRLTPYGLEDSTTLYSLPDGVDLLVDSAGAITLNYGAVSLSSTLSVGNDTTFLAVYDGVNIILYKDGVVADSSAASAVGTADPNGTITLLDGYSGWVNDFRIYDFALNSAEATLIG